MRDKSVRMWDVKTVILRNFSTLCAKLSIGIFATFNCYDCQINLI